MSEPNADWEKRNAELWAAIDEHDEREFVALMEALGAQLPAGDAVGLFERAAAFDSTGRPDCAVPLYNRSVARHARALTR